jgi:Fic family protein
VRAQDFSDKAPGQLIKSLQGHLAFSPAPLPPVLEASWPLTQQLINAERAVSELTGLSQNLPNPYLITRIFSRQEAVLSSRIEGTVSTISDLVLFEASEVAPTANEDAHEVHNYVTALEYGLARLPDVPITLRLIREIHERLMAGVRGGRERPGELRDSQNWIAPPGSPVENATYVPPPVPEMREALYALEKFINDERDLPLLIRVALMHYQFEAIHPFRDGNGRMGRLLITLMVCAEGALHSPTLYLSGFFERNRRDYYDLLLQVSQKGAWIAWLDFFLRGVEESAQDAIWRSRQLLDYWRLCRENLHSSHSSGYILRLLDELFASPAITAKRAAEILGVTPRTAQHNIDRLVKEGILKEVTGRQRSRIYLAPEIIRIIQAEKPAD